MDMPMSFSSRASRVQQEKELAVRLRICLPGSHACLHRLAIPYHFEPLVSSRSQRARRFEYQTYTVADRAPESGERWMAGRTKVEEGA